MKFFSNLGPLGTLGASMNNVVVTIHPSAAPVRNFATFGTGTLTGGGASFTRVLDVAGMPATEYAYVNVSGTFVPGSSPAWSSTIQMELGNGSGTLYWPSSVATIGKREDALATTLYWSGFLPVSFTGGGPLSIKFTDVYDDALGTYTSELNNVSVSVFPASLPRKALAPVTTGSLISGSSVTTPVTVTGTAGADYMVATVTGTFNAGSPAASSAFSNSIQMELNDGGSTIYLAQAKPISGALNNSSTTTLKWRGVLSKAYAGGGPLSVKFADTYNEGGPYNSSMSNVVVTLEPVYSVPTTVTSLNRVNATPSNAATVNWLLTFPTAVTGVTASNFSLSPTVTGASIGTPATGNGGLTWTIPVTTGTGDGPLQLNLANSTGLSRTVSSLPSSGQAYAIDKTAPTISIGPPSLSATKSGPVTYTVTYADANFSSSNLAFGNVTLNKTGADGTVVVSGTGSTRTVSISNITGNGSLGISVAAGTAVDSAGNLAPAAGPGTIFTVDNTAPVITSSTTAGGTYQSSFSSYTITASGTPATYGATGLPTGLSISGAVISGTPTQTGSFPVTISATDAVGNTGSTTLTITIAKATATVTLGGLAQTYNGTARTVSATTTPAGLTVGFTYNGSGTAPINAGSYPIAGTISDTNYQGTASGSLVVSKVALTVTPTAVTRAFAAPDPAFGFGLTGFVGTDNPAAVSGAPTISTTADESSTPGVYPLTATTGTLAAANYSFTFAPSTLTVSKQDPDDWKKLHFNETEQLNDDISGPLADADDDGVLNLHEMAFGTDPRNNVSGPAVLDYTGTLAGNGTLAGTGQPLTMFEPLGTGVDFRAVFIRRNPGFNEGLVYTPQFSADLITWQDSTAIPVVLAASGDLQVVSVPYPLFVGGKKARFFRISVSIVP